MSEWNGPTKNYTKTPNAVLDAMPFMGEAELRVTLAIVRATNGWTREWEGLSLPDLMTLTGMGKQPAFNGVKAALERGTIERVPDKNSFKYRLLCNEYKENIGQEDRPKDPETVNVIDRNGQRNRPIIEAPEPPNGQPTRPMPVNYVDQSEQETVNVIDRNDAPYKELKDNQELKTLGKDILRAPAHAGRSESAPPKKVPCPKCGKPVPVTSSSGKPVAVCFACKVDALEGGGAELDSASNPKRAVGRMLGYYSRLFEDRFGKKAHVEQGRDAGIMRDLLAQHGEDAVKRNLEAFVASDDEFIEGAGYSLKVLPVKFNMLTVAGSRNGQSRASPKDVLPKAVQKTIANAQEFINRGKS